MPSEPRFDPLANRLRYQILAVQAAGERAFDAALRERGLDLTATQAEVLEVLAEVRAGVIRGVSVPGVRLHRVLGLVTDRVSGAA